MALVWQGAWTATDPGLREAVLGSPARVMFIGASACWAIIAIATISGLARKGRPGWIHTVAAADAILLATGAILLAAAGDSGQSSPAESLGLMAMGVAGLMLPLRWSIPIAATTTACFAAASFTADIGAVNTVLMSVYVAVAALSCIVGRHWAMLKAGQSDIAYESLVTLQAHVQAVRGEEEDLRERERLLHETVLNTLNAIGHGAPAGESLSSKCRSSIQTLEYVSEPTRRRVPAGARASLNQQIEELRGTGCRVDVADIDDHALDGLARGVQEAVLGSLREALNNTARHAKAQNVRIALVRTGNAIEAEVDDDGTGYDTHTTPERFGTQVAIKSGMEAAGGKARITSAPGKGTRVLVQWEPEAEQPADRATRGVAIPILIAFGTFCALSFAVTITEVGGAAGDIAALALYSALALVLTLGRDTAQLSWTRTATVCLLAPGVYLLAEGTHTHGTSPWSHWGAEASLALLLVTVCTGPAWSWLAVITSWLIAMGDPLGELLQPGTAILVGGAVFASSIRRSENQYRQAHDEQLREETDIRNAQASLESAERRYSLLTQSHVTALLEGIASGAKDPQSEDVRRAAAKEERFIRSVMRLDPDEPASAMARALAWQAYTLGVILDVSIAHQDSSQEACERARKTFEEALVLADTERGARLSTLGHGSGASARLVAFLPQEISPSQGGRVVYDKDSGATMIEAPIG